MVAQSGLYPLNFELSLPFRLSASRTALDFGSETFEGILWSVTADFRRFGADPFIFLKYQHASGVPGQDAFYPNSENQSQRATSSYRISEPNASGAILVSGQVNTTDWINDIRIALSGQPANTNGLLSFYHSFDCHDDVMQAWISAKGKSIGGHGGGDNPWGRKDWTHPYYTGSGSPLFPFLGYSGQLFDIDLDEVYYHPIPRFCAFSSVSAGISGIPTKTFGIYPGRPLLPSFARTNGLPVTLNTFETNVVFSASFDYTHLASGLIRFDGDVLLSSGTYDFGGIIGTFQQSGIRNDGLLDGVYHPMISRAFILHPSGLSRSVGPVPVVVSHSGVVPSSGERISRYPAIPDDYVATIRRPVGFSDSLLFGSNTPTGPSGFEYFNNCLVLPTTYVAGSTGPRYGIQFLSPVSAFPIWVRFGSGVNAGASANWQPQQISINMSAHRVGTSILVLRDYNLAGTVTVDEYNMKLEPQATYTGTGGLISDGGSLSVGRFWMDGNDIYAIRARHNASDRDESANIGSVVGPSGYLNKWTYSTFGTATNYGSNNVDSTVNRRSCVGFFDGTNHYLAVSKAPGSLDTGSTSGFSQLTLINGAGANDNLFDFGPFEPIAGLNFNLPLPLVPISVVRVTSATSFNNGVWCLMRYPSSLTPVPSYRDGDLILGRIERSGGQWNIVELYANKNISPSLQNTDISSAAGGSYWQFILPIDID